jgi:hypothetical protein
MAKGSANSVNSLRTLHDFSGFADDVGVRNRSEMHVSRPSNATGIDGDRGDASMPGRGAVWLY